MARNYKRRRKFKRKRRGRRKRRPRKALSKVEARQVKRIVKSAIARADEWGYYDPPYHFKGTLTGPTMGFVPTQSPYFTDNTGFAYSSNHGLITEFLLSTKLGDGGKETREGDVLTIKRIMVRVQCNANTTCEYLRQNLRMYFIKQPLDSLTGLTGTELNALYNDILKTLPRAGQISSDIAADVKATKKIYKVAERLSVPCRLVNTGTALAGMKGNHTKMFNVNWPMKFMPSTDLSNPIIEPIDYRLFIAYTWGGYGQVLNPDVNNCPEFDTTINIWYTT